MNDTITIGNRAIGEDSPLFIIAECGVTCNYDLEITKELIDVVSQSGADAIKFIFWFPEEIMSDKSIDYTYETSEGTKTENMYEMLSKLKFDLEEWREIKQYADERDVIVFATVNSPSGIEFAEKLGLEAYKLSSWDYNHLPLWREIASIGKPMLIDTGPVRTLEVAKVMNVMQEENNEQSVLLHCFHTDEPDEMNMRAIPYMKKAFDTLVGFSSKDNNDETDITAVTLGATVLEKRLTLSRDMEGHHHVISKEPDEFEDYVEKINNVRKSLGEEKLDPSDADLEERKKWFRHLVANEDIPEGTELTREKLAGKRPEKGISPEFLDVFLGRTVNRDIDYNESIQWTDI